MSVDCGLVAKLSCGDAQKRGGRWWLVGRGPKLMLRCTFNMNLLWKIQ
jgi:hypothetical protein